MPRFLTKSETLHQNSRRFIIGRHGPAFLTVCILSAALVLPEILPQRASAIAPIPRITACGTMLCDNNAPWRLVMGSINGESDPPSAIAQAQDLDLNTIRLTDFLDIHANAMSGPYDPDRWAQVDKVIAAAGAAGLHVELDLSTYRNLLQTSGVNPYTTNWRPFLNFVVNRHNTVTGVRYGDDPTIALVSFAGEVEPINSTSNTLHVTTRELTNFYRRALGWWFASAPRQLLTAGGLMQLGWDSGIDWQSIFALPHNNVASLHLYSDSDRQQVVPTVATYTAQINIPWITEEFGFNSNMADSTRASLFSATYQLNRQYGSAGTGFWNIGLQTIDTFDVGPQFPQVSAAIRKEASAP